MYRPLRSSEAPVGAGRHMEPASQQAVTLQVDKGYVRAQQGLSINVTFIYVYTDVHIINHIPNLSII